ncbi:MAG: endonuclease I [Candidatus Krumholzibacteriia bacterium]|jgi:endonuclease I
MQKFSLRLLTLFVSLLAFAPVAKADIILSEICDPRTNYLTDRFIEIYNTGGSPVDLTGWKIVAVGNTNEIFTWNLSGSIAAGQALVAGDATTIVVFQVDFPEQAWSDNNATWNGKVGDGARLKNASNVVMDDAVVPGTTFENADMVRNQIITTPAAAFNVAEWTITPVFFPSEATPGSHFPPISQGPDVANIVTVPAAPLPGEAVNIQADVTDGLATITAVTLNWGTTSGVLNNPITMVSIGGDTYQTFSAIPAQSAGVVIYYEVVADNDIPDQTTSDEASYSLPYNLTITEIQGVGAVSPYVGDEVITSGVVTADFGTSFVIQDGTGIHSGVWVSGTIAPFVGIEDISMVRGIVQEIDGNTTITGAQVISSSAGTLPAVETVTSGAANNEAWEGVLVQVVNASCTLSDSNAPTWEISNTGGPVAVDDLGVSPDLVFGTDYSITGVISGASTAFGVVPRSLADVVFLSDTTSPTVIAISALGPTTVSLTFSEAVDTSSAQNTSNYSLFGETVTLALQTGGTPEHITLTVSDMADGSQSLTINGVEDLFSNSTASLIVPFTFYGGNIPPGYYDSAESLVGEVLRAELHNIIDNHSSVSYSGLWSAYYTTDDKPNGKVWDMYSDIPGGTPQYEYTFGTDQGGSAGSEGTGYNREHSWPSSWYGASSPMYTDIFMVYPTDNEVNNKRGSFPFGEVGTPTWTSTNGCKLGSSDYPGYSGTVFEPIDEYKGDFARAYFYMTTRYFGEDGSWAGSPMANGAVLEPWAEAMLLEWDAADPVSLKEIDRNDAVYDIQGNRNPFIDRPDFVFKVFQPELSAVPNPSVFASVVLHQNVPNPFNPSTVISYELESAGMVELQIYDVAGHLIKTLHRGNLTAGSHQETWFGRDNSGRTMATGVYFYRLEAGSEVETRRMLLAK